MGLYVGGTAVFSEINTPTAGKFTAAFNYVEVTEILHDWEQLTRGYIISGYQSSQCCDDINKTIYATNTTAHLSSTVTVGNYNGGWSGPETAKAIACNLGQCQGSPERTSAKQYQIVDMITDTKTTQGTMHYGRYAGSYWTQTDVQKGYATLGGSQTCDRYTFSNGTRDTAPSCSAGTSTYYMTAFPGHTYAHVADNATSNWQAMHNTNETWTTGSNSGPWYVTGVNPAGHTKSDIAYIGNQAVGNVRRLASLEGAPVIQSSHGTWPSYVCPQTANYYGEGNWMKGNYVARFLGGHDGIQHSKGGVLNVGTTVAWGVPAMDAYSDYQVCSGSGHWA